MNKIELCIHDIGKILDTIVLESWSDVVLGAFLVNEKIECKIYSFLEEEYKYVDVIEKYQLDNTFKTNLEKLIKLVNLLKNECFNNDDNWTELYFHLMSNNEFELSFDYNKINNLSDYLINWKKEYLI